jgi:uncharacterized membrane protein
MKKTMDRIPAQPIHRRAKTYFIWRRFQEWNRGSLLFYPFTFMLAAVLLVLITRQVDSHLIARLDVRDWWLANSSIGVNITSLVASSVISLLAIVFSISLVALQLANQQYSPQVISIFERAGSTKVALSLFIATFVYSFILLIEVLRTSLEQITIISIFTNVLLIFACLIVFIVFMKSIMLMIRVTYIITIVAENTREAIDDNLPQEETYIECQAVRMETPRQVIRYTSPRSMPFSKRYAHGVLRALQHSALVQIASIHNCTLRVLPHLGDYVNKGDPIVEVYGDGNLQAEQVLKAFSVEPERGLQQDPAYGIRMLVDIALKALSPAVNAPTTAREVILRLTNLLAMIAQRPEHSGAFADKDHQIRLLQPMTTWEEFVDLAFNEILLYGKDDPQTRQSLADAIDYLLESVPEAHKPPLIRQRMLFFEPQR